MLMDNEKIDIEINIECDKLVKVLGTLETIEGKTNNNSVIKMVLKFLLHNILGTFITFA